MNTSSWKKAADIVTKMTPASPQASAAVMVESQNLQSLPLSALSIDDSGPLQVTFEPQQPIATSTPQATDNSEIPTEAYRQILPGMSSRLYPTLIADSSLDAYVSDQQDTLQMQLSTEVDITSRRWQRSEKWMLTRGYEHNKPPTNTRFSRPGE